MRILFLTITIPFVAAFAPSVQNEKRAQTKLDVTRRDILVNGAAVAAIAAFPEASVAFSQQLDDHLTEPTQMYTGGKYDLNSAYVVSLWLLNGCNDCIYDSIQLIPFRNTNEKGDYMDLRGMYPTVAGKIASNGPYKTVKDMYKIGK